MKIKDLLLIIPTLQLVQIKFKQNNLLTPFLCKDTDFNELMNYNNYEINYITTKRIIDNIKYVDKQAILIVVEKLDLAEK